MTNIDEQTLVEACQTNKITITDEKIKREMLQVLLQQLDYCLLKISFYQQVFSVYLIEYFILLGNVSMNFGAIQICLLFTPPFPHLPLPQKSQQKSFSLLSGLHRFKTCYQAFDNSMNDLRKFVVLTLQSSKFSLTNAKI